MNDFFKLKKEVSRTTMDIEPEDVLSVKTKLKDLGQYKEPEWGLTNFADNQMFEEIQKFQKEKGLTVDGVMKPEGETEAAINQSVTKNKQFDYTRFGKDVDRRTVDEMLQDKHFQKALDRTHKNECGYVNNPNDRGCETNMGISKRWYPNEDIKNLTRERADILLYRDYWKQNHIDRLPDEIAGEVFDNTVNQETVTAVQRLHNVLGIKPGNIVGIQTLEKLNQNPNKSEILEKYKKERNRYYEDIVKKIIPVKKFFMMDGLNVDYWYLSIFSVYFKMLIREL